MTSIIKQTTRSVLKWFRRKRVNETLNNDVTVYWGYSKPHSLGLTVLVKYVSGWYISYGRYSIYSCVNVLFHLFGPRRVSVS